MSINYERLGDKLRQIRSDKDNSQEALAEATNLTRDSITRIENGSMKPKLETIADIANVLNVPVDYLINANDENKNAEGKPNSDPNSDILRLLNDCNHLEKRILAESLCALKKILLNEGI